LYNGPFSLKKKDLPTSFIYETVQQHIICCCEALARQSYNVFGNPLVEPKDISTACLSKGPVSLYKGHRVTEFVLIGIFRVAQ
jgi:hypothetical protein